MSSHGRDHEEFLEALAAGDVAADSAQARARLAECAECAEAWGALRALGGDLDRLGAEVRATTSPRAGAAQLEARVESMLEVARERPALVPRTDAPRARRRWAWVALAAGVLVVCALWARPWSAGSHDVALGDGEIGVEAPSGVLDARAGLRFDYGLPAGARFSIVLSGTGSDGSAFRTVEDTSESTWRPSATLLHDLPDKVRVRVEAIDATNKSLAASREFWLSVSR